MEKKKAYLFSDRLAKLTRKAAGATVYLSVDELAEIQKTLSTPVMSAQEFVFAVLRLAMKRAERGGVYIIPDSTGVLVANEIGNAFTHMITALELEGFLEGEGAGDGEGVPAA